MFFRTPLSGSLALLLATATLCAPLAGQSRTPEKPSPATTTRAAAKNTASEKSPVTIDNLLSMDAYKVYGEFKNVGTLVSTGSIAELIDPVMKLADPPKEFKVLIKFINANADMLADSRLMFATWPARSGIPNALVTIELATAEDAAKFEPKLTRVLPTILPTPTPTPAEKSPAEQKNEVADKEPPGLKEKRTAPEPVDPPKPVPPPFVVTRSGNLVFVTDRPFKFEKLRPAESKLLSEDQNFRQAHERFVTEPVFIFVNIALRNLIEGTVSENKTDSSQTRTRVEIQEPDQKSVAVEADEAEQTTPSDPELVNGPEENAPPPMEHSQAVLSARVEAAPSPTPAAVSMTAVTSLLGLLGGGPPEWPDAVGLALAQEADDYVIRSVLVGPQNSKRLVLPFVPQLMAGRSFTPNAPSILPDETEMLVSVSLDLSKTYQEMLVRLDDSNKERAEQIRKLSTTHLKDEAALYNPFVDFETKGGFKIKEELLPALGTELALAGSMKSLQGASAFGLMIGPTTNQPPEKDTEAAQAQKKRDAESSPAVLIAVNDRETARRLMPKVLDGLGVGVANMIGTPVKRDDTEMVDFAGAFAYGFVGGFLVISTTPTVRHIIDSYLNHQTLASNSAYRNYTRWQPSGITGQIYISPSLMESYTKAAHDPSITIAASMREYLLRLNPTPQAITYSLSHEGFGTLHELHLPKALVLATVAGAASATKETPPEMNEAIAISLLHAISGAEKSYQATEGSYATLDKLIEAKLVQKEVITKYGYRFDVTASGNEFEATATPVEYGKTGRLSYFIDTSGVLRGGDHGGGNASIADKPMQ